MPIMPPDRVLTFIGPIRPPLSANFRAALCALVNEGATKITILFASDGGSTDDGIALCTYLASLPVEITMHAIGIVGSIAIPVFLSAPMRKASANARFLFHEYNWTHTQPAVLSATTMEEQSMRLKDSVLWSQKLIKNKTKLADADFVSLRLFDHPHYMSPTDALKFGLIESIAEPTMTAAMQPRVVV